LQAYNENFPLFSEHGAGLLAISPMLPEFSMELHRELALSFDLLFDRGNAVASRIGLTFTVSPQVREVYKGAGLSIPLYNGDESWKLPIPATFVLDISGRVVLAWRETDHTMRLEPAEILETLQCLVSIE